MNNDKCRCRIFIALLSIIPIVSKGQTCEFVNSLMDYHWKKQYEYSLVCKKTDTYGFYGDDYLADIKAKLYSVFSKNATDSLIDIMHNIPLEFNLDCCKNPKIKLISYTTAKRIYRKNQKRELEYFSKNPLNIYTVFYIAPPIFYKEYVLFQYRGVVSSLNTVNRLLLFKYTNGKLNFYKLIYSSTS
jgi:hypothetical protein